MKRSEIILVVLMALLNFTHILDFMIMMPLGNILMPKWNINSSQFSIIVSSYSLAAFCSSFAAIFFADKFDRKKLLLTAYIGFLVGTFGCAFATNSNTMIVARIVTGIFGGLISAQILSIISDIIPYERRGQAMGLLMGGFALASVIGVPLGLFLANNYGWYFPFLLIAIFGCVLLPFLIKFVPNVTAHLVNPQSLKERSLNFIYIFKNETQVTALLFSFLLILGHFLIIPLLNPYMVYNVGVPKAATPLIYLFGGLSSIVTAQFVGKISDKKGKRVVFVFAAALSLLLILAVTNLPVLPVFVVIFIFSIWFSCTTARTVPGQAMTSQAVDTKSRGSFMSLNSCVQSLGTGFGGLISGWITYSDANFVIHHYNYLGYLSVAIISICIFLAYKLEQLLIDKKYVILIDQNK